MIVELRLLAYGRARLMETKFRDPERAQRWHGYVDRLGTLLDDIRMKQ